MLLRFRRVLLQHALVRNAATLRDIKNRMKTVITIKKITASMKAVAASKLKAAEKDKDNVQPFWRATAGQFSSLAAPEKATKYLICAIASDRGLCGSANSSVVRTAEKMLSPIPKEDINIFCIGDKSRAGLARQFKDCISHLATNLDRKQVSFAEILPFAEQLSKQKFDKLIVFSNKFINSLTFETIFRELPERSELITNMRKHFPKTSFEGNGKEIISDLYGFYVAGLLYSALIENIACELGSRMSSMDNATRNAGEMIGKLTLDFNRKRQASITSELTEIISGASSVETGIEY